MSHVKIKDGGGRHFEKSKNRHISAAVRAISTKFGTMTQFDPHDRSDCYKFEILKIQDDGDISAKVWPIGIKFSTITQIGPPNRSGA